MRAGPRAYILVDPPCNPYAKIVCILYTKLTFADNNGLSERMYIVYIIFSIWDPSRRARTNPSTSTCCVVGAGSKSPFQSAANLAVKKGTYPTPSSVFKIKRMLLYGTQRTPRHFLKIILDKKTPVLYIRIRVEAVSEGYTLF